MEIVRDPEAYRLACAAARSRGSRVGFVPTMGALHRGHAALMKEARKRGADFVTASIFLNPLQFNREEDYRAYPRPYEEDLKLCEEQKIATVFIPERESLYPSGFQTHVEVSELTQAMEGTCRPGHFRGVTTVVTKLLNLVGPCLAVFGRKDYQQWKVIERLVQDLHLPVEVIGHPTVRDPDGLALSSRNRLLPVDRSNALSIVEGLRAASKLWNAGVREVPPLQRAVEEKMEPLTKIDYIAFADPETLRLLEHIESDRALLAVAAYAGPVRLIDNVVLGEDPSP